MQADDQSDGPEIVMVPCRCQYDPPWRLNTCWLCRNLGFRPETEEERDHRLNGGGPYWDGKRWQFP